MKFFFLFVGVVMSSSWAFAKMPSDRLINAEIKKESSGDDWVIGDRNRTHKAYGCLQIRQPACDDINRKCHTHYQAEDCLGNRELSVEIYKLYIDMYATPKRLHHEPTDEDMARIWNGGPEGWHRASTETYGTSVLAIMRAQARRS